MENKLPRTLEELKKLAPPLRNVNIEHRQNFSRLDRLALWITEHVGSMGFFIIIFVWTFIWLLWNTLAPTVVRFDPYPGFVLWLFISNMIQLLLMPLIMIGQNLLSEHAEARAQADFEVNTRSEIEIETILLHLENQNRLIIEILHCMNKEKPS